MAKRARRWDYLNHLDTQPDSFLLSSLDAEMGGVLKYSESQGGERASEGGLIALCVLAAKLLNRQRRMGGSATGTTIGGVLSKELALAQWTLNEIAEIVLEEGVERTDRAILGAVRKLKEEASSGQSSRSNGGEEVGV